MTAVYISVVAVAIFAILGIVAGAVSHATEGKSPLEGAGACGLRGAQERRQGTSILKFRYLNLFVVPLLIAGCKSAPPVILSQSAADIQVGKSDPENNFRMIGPLTVYDGEGCGGFGYRGSYERAVTYLRNQVSYMGGDYAQIVSIQEPHLRGQCFDNVYSISANVYKKTMEQPSIKVEMETGEGSFSSKLRELKKLFDEGVLSKDEYEKQKAALLQKGI